MWVLRENWIKLPINCVYLSLYHLTTYNAAFVHKNGSIDKKREEIFFRVKNFYAAALSHWKNIKALVCVKVLRWNQRQTCDVKTICPPFVKHHLSCCSQCLLLVSSFSLYMLQSLVTQLTTTFMRYWGRRNVSQYSSWNEGSF